MNLANLALGAMTRLQIVASFCPSVCVRNSITKNCCYKLLSSSSCKLNKKLFFYPLFHGISQSQFMTHRKQMLHMENDKNVTNTTI